jgi:hypothetical protein
MIHLNPEWDLRRELDPKDPKLRSRNARDKIEPGSKPLPPEEDFINTSEVNTCRFWLMLKLAPRLKWEKRWEIYQGHLRTRIRAALIGDEPSSADAERIKRTLVREIAEKIEAKAWATMPTDFQKRMGVDRVLRH